MRRYFRRRPAGRPREYADSSEYFSSQPGYRCGMLKELRARHKEIARRAVLGQKGVDIARDLGLSPIWVNSLLRHNGEIKEYITELEEGCDRNVADIGGRIKELQPKALELLEKVLEQEQLDGVPLKPDTRVATAKHVLSMGGNSPITKATSLNASYSLTSDDIEVLKKRSLDADIIDVEEADECPATNSTSPSP